MAEYERDGHHLRLGLKIGDRTNWNGTEADIVPPESVAS